MGMGATTGRGDSATVRARGLNAFLVVSVAEGAAVTGAAVVFLARLSNLPPLAPVTSKVVPTETRKTSVYFLLGSSVLNIVRGLLEDAGEVAAGVAAGGSTGVAIEASTRFGRSRRSVASFRREFMQVRVALKALDVFRVDFQSDSRYS